MHLWLLLSAPVAVIHLILGLISCASLLNLPKNEFTYVTEFMCEDMVLMVVIRTTV